MASERRTRDEALRELLVSRAQGSHSVGGAKRSSSPGGRQVTVVTAVVLIAVVALSIAALQFSNRQAPVGGASPTATATDAAAPAPTLPTGLVLGRFSSTDGPNQNHTIHPNGLALATLFDCRGEGRYLTSIAHWGDQGGEGSCAGGGISSGNKGVPGSTTVKIRTAPQMTWTFTVVGIPETYVTPSPIPTPTDSTGSAVRYCTSADLSARFRPLQMPNGVTRVNGGELVFTNRSAQTCALAGYPEVRFLSRGQALGHNTMNHIDDRDSTKHGLQAVILKPRAAAYDQIDWYLPNYYNGNNEGTCVKRNVTDLQVDLHYDLADPNQTGTLTVPIGTTTACLNGQHGALGEYGQISSTVFFDYTLDKKP